MTVAAAVAIVVVGYEPAPAAPLPGSASAARYVDASIGPDDVVILTGPSTFSFAISSRTPVGVQATPDHQVGFAPVFLDPRILNVGAWAASPATPAQIRASAADAERAFVVCDGVLCGPHPREMRALLVSEGFRPLEPATFEWSTVEIYAR